MWIIQSNIYVCEHVVRVEIYDFVLSRDHSNARYVLVIRISIEFDV